MIEIVIGLVCEMLISRVAHFSEAHLYASAISDHVQGLHSREVLRQAKIDVVPIYKPAFSA